jgi:hypothetical protein
MKTSQVKTLIILVIILVGFGFRIYQLGHDSFWNDEAGQALAAMQPTLEKMWVTVRAHVMAMPLDYLVSRMISSMGVEEALMRSPSLIYGTLTLALYFIFVQRVAKFEVAVMATWLLSLSIPHIHYSQEMRFYAALCLFYMLSSILLFRAQQNPNPKNWVIFVLVTSVGIYFHPYVLLVLVSGFLYAFLNNGFSKKLSKELLILSVITIILGLVFLPGYLYFGAGEDFTHELFQWTESFARGLFLGLGWLSFPYTKTTPAFGIWEWVSVIFTLVGLAVIVKQAPKNKLLISAAGGAFIQILLIVLANWVKGYWFAPRQVIHLAPMIMIITALGIETMLRYLSRMTQKLMGTESQRFRLLFALSMLLLGLMALPKIADYYDYPKSNGEQITAGLLETYQGELPVYILQGSSLKVYRFYLKVDKSQKSASAMKALEVVSWQELQQWIVDESQEMYVIMPAVTPQQQAQLEYLTDAGFSILVAPGTNWHQADFLLER